jgi:predicted transcriptional regulator
MMKIPLSEDSLPVFEAIASKTRIRIIELLSRHKMNLKELADALSLSVPVVGRHVNVLEKSGIIKTERVPGKAGVQKRSILKVDNIDIEFPNTLYTAYESTTQAIPVGHFDAFEVHPTCGLATEEHMIGQDFDDPRYFMDPEKANAEILWFTQGYLEYRIPNLLKDNQQLQMIDWAMEIGSEFPYSNNVWPSDITFSLNGTELCTWESPGDFADVRGRFTPDWWPSDTNQYGTFITIRISDAGVYVNNQKLSTLPISQLNDTAPLWNLRMAVKKDAVHVGGLTLYGKGFGNYDQDMQFVTYYTSKD